MKKYKNKQINNFLLKKMIAWTNKSDLNLSSLSKEKIQKLDINKISGPPKKIYFKESCIIILTENGDVYKKGKYNFIIETNEEKENEEWKPIIKSREITKIKFGYYHILFLSKKGKIYSLGDNYYGQLGINKMMNAMTKNPIEVKYRDANLIGKKIHAYKYNSFVIDKENKLFIWGKTDYLMGIYKFNLFIPTIFIPDYKVDDIKHSEGRIIIHAYKEIKSKEDNTNGLNDDDIYEMEANLKYKENENLNLNLKDDKSSEQNNDKSLKKDDNISEISKNLNINQEKEKEENVKDDIQSFVKSIKSKKEDFKEEQKNTIQIKAEREKKRKKYKTISQSMEEFSNKIITQEPYLKKIKQYLLNKEPLPFLEKENLNLMRDDLWEKLNKIISDNNSIQQINLNLKIPNSKRLALFAALFTVNISLFLEKIDFKTFVDSFNEMSKKCEDLFKKVQNNSFQKDKIINNNIFNILNNALIYKNAENYIFEFSVFQYLFKNIDFEVLLKNLEDIFNESSELQTNSFLIEHIYQNIISINSLFEEHLMRIKTFYTFSHLKISDLQKYIFKYIIETNEDIRDYWLFFCYHCKEEYILRIKKRKMDDIHQYFKNHYKKYKNIFDEYKTKFEQKYVKSKINANDNNDENVFQLYDNFIEEIKENVKDEFYNEENKNEIMKKEMIIDFSTSVIQMFETKKLLLMLLLKYDDDGKI